MLLCCTSTSEFMVSSRNTFSIAQSVNVSFVFSSRACWQEWPSQEQLSQVLSVCFISLTLTVHFSVNQCWRYLMRESCACWHSCCSSTTTLSTPLFVKICTSSDSHKRKLINHSPYVKSQRSTSKRVPSMDRYRRWQIAFPLFIELFAD